MNQFLRIFFTLLLLSPIVMQADWTKSLGSMQKSDSVKKSYLSGMLLQKSYGIYKIEKLYAQNSVKALYQKNDNTYYWFNESGEINYDITNMIDAIKHASSEGLDPQRYHLDEILFLYKKMTNGMLFNARDHNLAVSKLDILLSDAFFTLTSDLTQSQIDFTAFQNMLYKRSEKEKIDYQWDNSIEQLDKMQLLDHIKSSGNIVSSIYAYVKKNTIYNGLKDAYQRYKAIEAEGGFAPVSKGAALKVGARSPRVVQLGKRLSQTGDLDYFDDHNKKFDNELKEALKKFQKRVGLWPSGILNSTTVKALNVPVEKRLEVIKLNLERSRWEKESFHFRHILVNIPEFQMRFLDGRQKLMDARVIVGKTKNPTPIFESQMSYIVLNPRWSVPNSIVAKELLSRIQEDPYYLEDRNYKMYDSWKRNRQELDAFDVDWFAYDEESKIPFNIVKEPGKGNPLGNVKFMFPNNHAVYMHDTPKKYLFKKSVRAYSHGCIRLQNPHKLLEFVSQDYLESPYKTIKNRLGTGENYSMPLNEKIPVYIRYYTAYVDEEGGVNFGKDIYGYDKIQKKLLKKSLN